MQILITYEEFFDHEMEAIIIAFKSGVSLLHVRKPKATELEYRKFLDAIPDEYYGQIMIHEHHHLAGEYPINGIHLKDGNWKEVDFMPNLCYSASIHQLNDLKGFDNRFDYVFISPIFDSLSKHNYKAAFTLDELKEGLAEEGVLKVALGGVSPINIVKMKPLGFDGYASLGYIWNDYLKDKSLYGVASRVNQLLGAHELEIANE